MALREDESAGYETSSPLIVFCSVLAAVSGNVFLGDPVDDRANSRPNAGARLRRTLKPDHSGRTGAATVTSKVS